MIFVKIPTMGDDSIQTQGYEDGTWFVADSFSFGVEREMKESSEKGDPQDINIGVGELQECTISKSLDVASTPLLNSPSTATLWGLRRSTSWKSQAAPMGNRSATSSTNWTGALSDRGRPRGTPMSARGKQWPSTTTRSPVNTRGRTAARNKPRAPR